MTIYDFDQWIRGIMDFSIPDKSLNGLQVGQLSKPIKHIAFALDACQASFSLAQKADLLFVHHGLFWGETRIDDQLAMYPRIQSLVDHDLALYAVHLPLDMASGIGNNSALAQKAGLLNLEPFAKIGLIGDLPSPISTQDLAYKVFHPYPHDIWPHHSDAITRLAIVSGGGARESFVQEAINRGANGYLTGELNHQIYHYTSELYLSVIAGGHYWSEFIGLQHFASVVAKQFPDLTISIYDLPTGC
ncbi:Nif3-like dinuclear metal center hexameric protein [Entomospira entomophila]|uniref:Nif3-like dinuclear metal center hexameric protein n=1 Tax=Entomospira entomophila TaxID=2719988 RepID=A0A968GDA2_9SPIO|nr:Nif3-like dinuclear metal center hexameric protein [Entomospira entomophilus]NIZ40884.1 Nif3-like dinuclear metal center hexameric protein [Entomospira entomophilus]WDI35097.1 Nif3-like dinuclear metal center hexameric protein [Entomospira entomophilus]